MMSIEASMKRNIAATAIAEYMPAEPRRRKAAKEDGQSAARLYGRLADDASVCKYLARSTGSCRAGHAEVMANMTSMPIRASRNA